MMDIKIKKYKGRKSKSSFFLKSVAFTGLCSVIGLWQIGKSIENSDVSIATSNVPTTTIATKSDDSITSPSASISTADIKSDTLITASAASISTIDSKPAVPVISYNVLTSIVDSKPDALITSTSVSKPAVSGAIKSVVPITTKFDYVVPEISPIEGSNEHSKQVFKPIKLVKNTLYSICVEGDHSYNNGDLIGPLVEDGSLDGLLNGLYDISFGDEVSGCTLMKSGLDSTIGLIKYMGKEGIIDSSTKKTYLSDVKKIQNRI